MKVEKFFLRNFLIIEKAVIELSNGMTTVTGETGSGKSLFISAMKALKGQRISKDLVGRWNSFGEITAEIKIEKEDCILKERFEKHSICPEDGGRIILKRLFGVKSGAYINDFPVSIALLGELFSDYIEIGSQFENRELFKKDYRVSVLDTFLKNHEKVKEYRNIYATVKDFEKKISELEVQDNPGKRDYLEYQINEIGKLEIRSGEDKDLSEKINYIDNRAKILTLGEELNNVLESLSDKAQKASDLAEDLAGLTDIKDIDERISSSSIELADIYRSFSLPDPDFEDADPEEMRKRFDKISSILMKHTCSDTEELFDKFEKMKFELEDLNEVPLRILQLKKDLEKAGRELYKKAEALRSIRQEGAPELKRKISEYLKKFGMYGVDLCVDIEKMDVAGENGIDDVVFRINTTGSDEHSDISSLSGGELSRFLLAVKLIDREKGRVLLFDEIDSSIGGETAKNASMEMKRNSKHNQIVVVTHFPQTAASADEHLVVEKKVVKGKVSAKIRKLDENEKTKELARMMGDSSSSMFNNSASEMLREG